MRSEVSRVDAGRRREYDTPRHPQGLLVVQEAPRAVSRYLVPNWRVTNFKDIPMMRLQVYPPGLQVYIRCFATGGAWE